MLRVLSILYDVLRAGISLFEDNYPYLRKTRWAFSTLQHLLLQSHDGVGGVRVE